MKKAFLEIGKIVAVHGVVGEVRVQPWCDTPDVLAACQKLYWDEGKTPVQIKRMRVHKNMVVLLCGEAGDRDAAQALRGKILYVDRNAIPLPPDTYFVQDLLGMQVIDADDPGTVYGTIIDVTETGANDVYHVKDADGKVVLIPAIAQVVQKTDVDAGILTITPLKGLFDDAD